MGRDKALLPVDGSAMAARVADALRRAGCDPVLAFGGDLRGLAEVGLPGHPDPRQGDGPLAGLAGALAAVAADTVVVCACDLPDLAPDDVVALLAADRGRGAVAWSDRVEPLCALWPRRAALTAATALLAAGERSMRALVDRLDPQVVPLAAAHLRNVNRPEDLGRD